MHHVPSALGIVYVPSTVIKDSVKEAISIKLLTSIGIAAIVLQLNAVPLSYFLFHLNQDEIARTLCERKMPHCNGHCYLVKQIAKNAAQNSDRQSSRASTQLDQQYLLTSGDASALFPHQLRRIPTDPTCALSSGWLSLSVKPPRSC